MTSDQMNESFDECIARGVRYKIIQGLQLFETSVVL